MEIFCKTLSYFLVAMDVQVMLFLGFGYLMTFLKRFGYSALVQTMFIIGTHILNVLNSLVNYFEKP